MRFVSLLTVSVLGVLGITSTACHRVHVDDVRTADGSDWKKLSCHHMDKHCFKTAQRLCPNGYYFTRAGTPIDERLDAERAREAEVAPHAGPPPGATVKKLPPQEHWDRGMYSRRPGAILIQCAAPAM
jgi:hypothetical protein